jgi:drug/metabolite transporter (DMT)-like permease
VNVKAIARDRIGGQVAAERLEEPAVQGRELLQEQEDCEAPRLSEETISIAFAGARREYERRLPEPQISATIDGPAVDNLRPLAMYWIIGVGLCISAVVGFSLRPVLIKAAYIEMPDPITILALRMMIALPIFIGMAAWTHIKHGTSGASARDIAAAVGLGCIGYYAASTLDFIGLQYVPAGIGRLILFLYTSFVFVLSSLFLGTPIRGRDVLALMLIYSGLALGLAVTPPTSGQNMMLGVTLILAGAMLIAIYLVSGSQVVNRLGAVRYTSYAMMSATVCCVLQFAMLRPLSALDVPQNTIVLCAVLTVVSVLPEFFVAEALRRIGANQVAIIGALGPISTMVFGYVALGETMTMLQLLGASLVVGGIVAVSRARARHGQARNDRHHILLSPRKL